METQIKAYYHSQDGIKLVSIFGYASKGVPGLEVHGAGKLSRNIKEKMIFLTRQRQLKIPLRRFVICLDQTEASQLDEVATQSLEFPFLLVYWFLAGLIPIKKLENCVASGWVNTEGEIRLPHMNDQSEREILKAFTANRRNQILTIGREGASINAAMLLGHIPELKFKDDSRQGQIIRLLNG